MRIKNHLTENTFVNYLMMMILLSSNKFGEYFCEFFCTWSPDTCSTSTDARNSIFVLILIFLYLVFRHLLHLHRRQKFEQVPSLDLHVI